jgi:hypothetical protein
MTRKNLLEFVGSLLAGVAETVWGPFANTCLRCYELGSLNRWNRARAAPGPAAVTARLEEEGVNKFAEPFRS